MLYSHSELQKRARRERKSPSFGRRRQQASAAATLTVQIFGLEIRGNFGLPAIAVREEFFLVVKQLFVRFG